MMKKLLLIVLTIALMLPLAALSEAPDYSAMSLKELKALRSKLCELIFEREYGAEMEVVLTESAYLIGSDLPAGTYQIMATEKLLLRTSQVDVFETADIYSKWRAGETVSVIEKLTITRNKPPITIVLEEGNVLYHWISDGTKTSEYLMLRKLPD